ncbi:MAG: hypothetical protein Ta2B_12800 [Termitinemataceae bacterium]|nr:MAG: hypothetical protein Ta2B_12800 [Termitinemataceae bacterium]
MNTNFLNIIKRIVAEQGEGILTDPQRLKAIVKDYAKGETKEDRVAFGRCIEAGCYNELKRAATAQERRRLKRELSARVASASLIDTARCAAALDIIEAAISPAPQSTSMPSSDAAAGARFNLRNFKIVRLSRKTILFGIVGGIGAFIGNCISDTTEISNLFDTSFWGNTVEMSIWAGFISLFVSIGLVAVQYCLSKKLPNKKIITPLLLGIISGTLAGGFAQIVFGITQNISSVVMNVSNALCWGILGCGLGWGVSFFVPNFPSKRAKIAGLLGGTLGGTIYVALLSSGTNSGGIIGVIVLGATIGLAISYIEEALREVWLTIIWGPKETTTVALGAKPVSFGSSREADIYLPAKSAEQPSSPIRAVFKIENGKIIMDDRLTNQCSVLRGGDKIDLGRVCILVHTKGSRFVA